MADPLWERPTGLQNPQLRQIAHAAAKRLRARRANGEAIAPDQGLDWLAELIQTLANRIPQPRPESGRKRGRR